MPQEMKITYRLSEEDYVAFQMYISSVSEQHIQQRNRNRLVVPILSSVLSFAMMASDNGTLGLILLLCSIGSYFVYPRFTKGQWERHFRKLVQGNYQKHIGVDISIELGHDGFTTATAEAQSELSLSSLDALVELERIYVIRFGDVHGLAVPKEGATTFEFIQELSSACAISIEDIKKLVWT